MEQRTWPTREEWAAKAEYSVRTFCTMYERLPADMVFTTLAEDTEASETAQAAAAAIRPLLNKAIADLKTLAPDRPKAGRARIDWFVSLEGERWETACNLAALEEIRRDIARSAKAGAWATIAWELCRIRKSYPAIVLTEQLKTDIDRLKAIGDLAGERRRAEAQRLEDEAVARCVAHRATDEAWATELERRARIAAGPVVTIYRAGSQA